MKTINDLRQEIKKLGDKCNRLWDIVSASEHGSPEWIAAKNAWEITGNLGQECRNALSDLYRERDRINENK